MFNLANFCCAKHGFKQIKLVCSALVFSFLSVSVFADNPVTGSGTECVYSTLNTYTGPSIIKANWDPNTINLYWYNDDQKLTVQTAANTCDYDSGISLPTTNPTKTGYTFTGWEVYGGVPTGYTILEYVSFNGVSSTGSYVDTGLKFYTNIQNSKIRFVADAKLYQGSGWQVIVGNLGSASAYIGSNSSNLLYYGFGGSDTSTTVTNPYVKCHFDLDLVAGTYKIDNLSTNTRIVNVSGITATARTTSLPIYLGGFNDTTGSSAMRAARAKMDLYSIRIYNNGTLAFNGIPVKRVSDSAVGIYDTVSNSFKTAASGTTALSAGPVVQ